MPMDKERGGRKDEKGSKTTDTTHKIPRAFKGEDKKTDKNVRDDPPAPVAYEVSKNEWEGSAAPVPPFVSASGGVQPYAVPKVQSDIDRIEREMALNAELLVAEHDSPWLEKYVFPDLEKTIWAQLKLAKTTEDLYRTQGAARLLDNLRDLLKSTTARRKQI